MRNFDPLPITERLELPERFSQTLLSKADDCPRSAHLYRKYDGGPRSHHADRGSAFHEFAHRATNHLIENDEQSLPGELGKDLMNTVLSEPGFVVPAGEQDGLRGMAWNWCEATTLDPDRIVAVEGLLEAELVGVRVSGRLDLVELVDDQTLLITDYKTSLNLPNQETFERGFQLPFYAVLCSLSDWGAGIQRFVVQEKYPRYTRANGELSGPNPVTIHRRDLPDHIAYLERLVARAVRIFTDGDAPAVPGDHCRWCVARAECPIPAVVRPEPPESVSDARMVAEQFLLTDEVRKDQWSYLKGWVSDNGTLELDGVRFELSPQERRSIDWDRLEAGAPVESCVKVSQSTTLRKRAA